MVDLWFVEIVAIFVAETYRTMDIFGTMSEWIDLFGSTGIMEILQRLLDMVDSIQDFLWTYVVITMLVGCAIYFTIGLRGVQFLRFGEMMRLLLGSTRNEKGAKSNGAKRINSFQAFAVSLSSRVGTGNLAGVASAIAVGGPGAVFWMWVMALFGAATAFMEATLAQLYKRRGADAFYGGPAYYMQYGLHRRWMGIIFAVFIIFGFGMANQIVQSNTICDALVVVGNGMPIVGIEIKPIYISIAITLLTLLIIFGGIQRISRFSSVVVPIMAVGYLVLVIVVLVQNIGEVPAMLSLIVKSAFGIEQVAGGTIGMAVMQGVKRGLFSNEAGEGSAPNAAATATISHPVKQGLLQALGVFTDTLLICTCTAFVILLSGLYANGEDGILLTGSAMQHHLGAFGRWFLTAAIFLFAYSTIIANYFYGETNVRFISQSRTGIFTFRIITGITVLLGGVLTLQQAWSIVDLAMALMTMLNLLALILLSRKAFALYRDYIRQRKEGNDPVFCADQMPEEKELEGW